MHFSWFMIWTTTKKSHDNVYTHPHHFLTRENTFLCLCMSELWHLANVPLPYIFLVIYTWYSVKPRFAIDCHIYNKIRTGRKKRGEIIQTFYNLLKGEDSNPTWITCVGIYSWEIMQINVGPYHFKTISPFGICIFHFRTLR